jgi:hypothetical protein
LRKVNETAYEWSIDSKFQSFTVAVSSKLVLSKLIQKNAIFMWNLMVSLSVERGKFGWKIFETYCQNRMLGEPKEYFDYKYHNGTKLVIGPSASSLKLGGCTTIKGTRENLITAAKSDEHVLFYSLSRNHVLIDFIYRAGSIFYAFQVSIAENHCCDPKYLLKFEEEAGGPSNFILHYLTYEGNFDKFELVPSNPLMQLPMEDKWTIYVVCIPRPDKAYKNFRL